MGLLIDRCVCHDTSFEEIKAYAETHALTEFIPLWQACDFGKGCGMCRPYVKRMLETGETAYTAILRDAPDPLIELGMGLSSRKK